MVNDTVEYMIQYKWYIGLDLYSCYRWIKRVLNLINEMPDIVERIEPDLQRHRQIKTVHEKFLMPKQVWKHVSKLFLKFSSIFLSSLHHDSLKNPCTMTESHRSLRNQLKHPKIGTQVGTRPVDGWAKRYYKSREIMPL